LAIKSTTQQPFFAFFKLKPLPPSIKKKDIFKDIDSSNNNKVDSIFKAQVKAEFKAKDNSIKLDNLNNVKFINNRQKELLLNSLISDVINLTSKSLITSRTYKEVLNSLKKQINNKHLLLLSRVQFEYLLIQQYVQNLLKKSPRQDRIKASLLVAKSNHPTRNRKTLACKIKALYLYYRTYGLLSLKTRGGKQKSRSYLNNKDVYKAYKAWLLAQKLVTVTPKGF
jgi:hypothetical protein